MLENESYLKEITSLFLGISNLKGFMAELETMEVGSLGHFSSASGNMLLSLSKKAISCP